MNKEISMEEYRKLCKEVDIRKLGPITCEITGPLADLMELDYLFRMERPSTQARLTDKD